MIPKDTILAAMDTCGDMDVEDSVAVLRDNAQVVAKLIRQWVLDRLDEEAITETQADDICAFADQLDPTP